MKWPTRFTDHAGVAYPIVCGAMYPCSNPELVAAVSDAGGLGIVQPLSLTYVHGYDFRDGLRTIRRLTDRPIGLNATIEGSSRTYQDRLKHWIDIGLEEGIRFFDTSLGNPKWVVERVKQQGGVVYHKVTERKWALKAVDAGVDGLIAVNSEAGGHAGTLGPDVLRAQLGDLNLPVFCGGGIGDAQDFLRALRQGYDGVLMATRFIATEECTAHAGYKRAIVDASASDIVLTERVTGVALSVIRTDYTDKVGYRASPPARWMLQHRKLKKMVRLVYALRSMRRLKQSAFRGSMSSKDYYQAGRSVRGIHAIEKTRAIIDRFVAAASGA